jgi:hypothetical protein
MSQNNQIKSTVARFVSVKLLCVFFRKKNLVLVGADVSFLFAEIFSASLDYFLIPFSAFLSEFDIDIQIERSLSVDRSREPTFPSFFLLV